MNRYLFLCCMFLLGAGCSSSDSSAPSSLDYPDDIAGNWFICEFNSTSDCSVLDDDGIALTSAGEVLRIEESGQGSLAECDGSPCFSGSMASVQAIQSAIGNYTYANGQLTLSIGGCNETSTLLVVNAETFIQVASCDTEFDDSEDADGSLLREYSGNLEFVNNPD